MSRQEPVVRVALKTPVATCFDYLADEAQRARPGVRVRVPFGRGQRVGVVVETDVSSRLEYDRLRRIGAVLDAEPVIDAALLGLLRWAASYYRHPPGEVIAAALPRLLRAGKPAEHTVTLHIVTDAGRTQDLDKLGRRAPRQAAALNALIGVPDGLDAEAMQQRLGPGWRAALARLESKGWAQRREGVCAGASARSEGLPPPYTLTAEQTGAIARIDASAGCFGAFLLNGVTGSGKTEVYLQLIARANERRQQALVLVPEIGLTPQLVERFQRRLGSELALMHSGLSDGERLAAWREARAGNAGVIVGTRSAVFAPLARPGLIVVDEEHDASYKQQDGFRYSARDLAVVRAQRLEIPVVLGSATPSFETLHNVSRTRYERLDLRARPGAGQMPSMHLIDMRRQPVDAGLSLALREAMQRHLDAGGQVLLFLNRRGFAPAWYCPGCGWLASCKRCDARMTLHQRIAKLRCHHCGAERRPETECPDCSNELVAVGQGTERIEETIARIFPTVSCVRIDRDTTRKRGALASLIGEIRAGTHQVLIGTQMLTKGHHFPDVSLVGIVDADQGLFGTDPRANERLAQLVVQVAGRAGRAERHGEVLIQTHCPQHPLLNTLLEEGYERFAEAALAEREAAGWPPYVALAMLRAEAADEHTPMRFLAAARDLAGQPPGVQVLGPAPAPMSRRAGRYRAQLLLQGERSDLQRFLRDWASGLAALPGARRTRYSLDVDPLELF